GLAQYSIADSAGQTVRQQPEIRLRRAAGEAVPLPRRRLESRIDRHERPVGKRLAQRALRFPALSLYPKEPRLRQQRVGVVGIPLQRLVEVVLHTVETPRPQLDLRERGEDAGGLLAQAQRLARAGLGAFD